jgi:hypothetical protein
MQMKITMLFLLSTLVLFFAATMKALSQDLPKPKLGFVRVSEQVNNGVAVKMYEVGVENREKFDNDLFVPSPALPPCGRNPNASRTWVDIFDGEGKRLYGWCALNAAGVLASLKFIIPASQPQPEKLYIQFNDRLTRQTRRSKTIKLDQVGR